MKQILLPIFAALVVTSTLQAQSLNKSIDKDSLLRVILKNFPEEKRKDLLKAYNEGTEDDKEFLLIMLSMPRSSKKALIANIDSNYTKIAKLKTEYAKLVPANYTVMIEFNPEDKIVNTPKSIDLRITSKQGKTFQAWNLDYNSAKLARMLKTIHWDQNTLKRIAGLLADAHCISIENGEPATIGFARSGMGKYFYKLFAHPLTSAQIKEYTNTCNDIFYKRNIVLEYLGGAVGSQCFPD